MSTVNDATAGPEPDWREALSPQSAIFLAGFLGLFVELALIRWVSCEVRVFAYCKNLILVASFLGFGIGCLQSRRRESFQRAMFLLLLLVLCVRLPWESLLTYGPRRVSSILARLSGLMIFHDPQQVPAPWAWSDGLWLVFALGWTALIFFVVALIMLPFGQVTGSGIARMANPLRGYSISVAGSLAGIAAFTAFTAAGVPPVVWFTPAVLACSLLVPRRQRHVLLGISLAVLLVLLPNNHENRQERWSSYQKLVLVDKNNIIVNNTYYQFMVAQQPRGPNGEFRVDRFNMAYALRGSAGRVLIVGAGSGNDAAAALVAGAESVTAVEIDSTIYAMGSQYHPQNPYGDERVRVVIDDARHFLKTTDQQFDVIVFSHLDSHTNLSSYTNVRLDNYIYTVEAFEEARSRLAADGILYVSFYAETPYIGARLARNLELAYGHPPVALEEDRPQNKTSEVRAINLLIGEPGVMQRLKDAPLEWPGFSPASYTTTTTTVVPSTDRWPFLPLSKPHIPPLILLISGVILLLSAGFVHRQRPRGEPFDGHVFWLGAAFMLLEVHNVSRLALVFGTTWRVNAWVIGAILSLILVANFVTDRLRRRGSSPGRLAVIGLFASLAIAYGVPLAWFATRTQWIGGALATVALTLPIFFAALVFAEAFAESSQPTFALGWNTLGAVLGGVVESLSYIVGIPALVLIAALFYGLALVWGRRRAERPSVTA